MTARLDHARTGRLVIAGVWACAAIVMVSSARNGALSFAALGEHPLAGFALGVAVDVALAVALVGDRALHLAGRSSAWGRALRITTCAMSGALNCAVPLWLGHVGVAAFHSFLTILLVLLTEYAQDGTLQFGDIEAEADAAERAEAEAQQRATDKEIAAQREVERRERDERQAERDAVAELERDRREHETQQMAALMAVSTHMTRKRKRATSQRSQPRKRVAESVPVRSASAHPLDEPEVPGESAEDRRRRLDRNRKRRHAAKQAEEQHEQRRPVSLVKEA
jgi:hypothetical protein